MKLKTPFLLIALLIISVITVKPFDNIKDFLFTSFHNISSSNQLSNDFKESIMDNFQDDMEELKKLNNISLSISDFNIINATVISRNREYWFNTLTINRGSDDGINLDMAVIDNEGLIGRISKVTKKSAIVKLITTNDTKNKVSAVINNKNEKIYGIISGYDSINNLLYLTITDNTEIMENSKVETTGMGGVFTRGILIGKVFDTIKKDDGITNIVRIKPSSNIEGERYVSVLQRKEITFN